MDYFERENKIIGLAKNKRVLHLGCVGGSCLDTSIRVGRAKDSLHYKLTEIADTTGIDYSSDVIQTYENEGIFDNIVFGDAENLDEVELDDTFDVIVAGDIIEHVSNPGLMLEGLKRFCNANTKLIITTPHAFNLMNFFRYLFGKFHESKEHVMTFNIKNILNLLKKHGYDVKSIDTCYQKRSAKYTLFYLGLVFFRMFPKFGGTLFVVSNYNNSN